MAKSTVGAYHPVVTDLRAKITRGDLQPGDMLPSESQLMGEYGVSRYSAREAVKRLAADGLIVVVDGRGSHVRARADRARHNDHRGLRTPAHENGPDTSAHVTDAEYDQWTDVEPAATYRMNATTDLALTLGIPEHAPLFAADRLRVAAPAAGPAATGRRLVHRLIVPVATVARIPELDPFATPDDVYAALTNTPDIAVTITEHIRAVTATPDDTESLNIPNGAAILLTRRVLRDQYGTALAMEETRRNSDGTQLTYTITPAAPAAPVAVNLSVVPSPARRDRARKTRAAE